MSEFTPMKWLRKPESEKQRDRWVASEKKVEKAIGGHRRAGSGAHWSAKGDVKSSQFLCEVKQTAHNSIKVHKSVFDKIETEAIMARKMPVLVLSINGRVIYCVREVDFKGKFMEDEGGRL